MVAPADVNEEVLALRKLSTMRQVLGFTDYDEMQNFVSDSPEFAPYFYQYATPMYLSSAERSVQIKYSQSGKYYNATG